MDFLKQLETVDNFKIVNNCFHIQKAFYSKFYLPEKESHPQEIENTDQLSKTLVVRFPV